MLTRNWAIAAAFIVAGGAGAGSYLAVAGGSPSTHVLGETITGSGSSNVTTPVSNGSGSSSNTAPGNGAGNNGNGNGNGGSNGNNSPGHAFTISGSITGLFPGAVTKLYLTVTNPNNQAMTVTGLAATLQSVTTAPGRGACAATPANLNILPYTGERFDVGKNSQTISAGYIGLLLPSSVSGNCQDAIFNLVYKGTAVQK